MAVAAEEVGTAGKAVELDNDVGELAVVQETSLDVVSVLGGPRGKGDVDGSCTYAVAGFFIIKGRVAEGARIAPSVVSEGSDPFGG